MSAAAPRRKVMTQAVNVIFGLLKEKAVIQVWLHESTSMKIEGTIVGFDEFMNVVLDDASELHVKSGNKTPIGRIMLKGDNICALHKKK
jgi:small nuclear ribonucleoprotein E